MAQIIINADDFGFDHDTTSATIDCFNRGGLTSATIMANMPATEAAVSFARWHLEFSFGAHLTLTSDGVERAVLPHHMIPDISCEDGQFLPALVFRSRALRRCLPLDQVERELEAQLGKLRDLGLRISHVDSHGHVHKYRSVREALCRVLPRFGITRVRTVQDLFLRWPLTSPAFWLGPVWRRSIRDAFSTTPHLYMPTTAGDRGWASRLLAQLPDALVEVGVHPGMAETWRHSEHTESVLLGRNARSQGHSLITWNDVR